MSTKATVAEVIDLPLRRVSQPEDRIYCNPEQVEATDFRTLYVAWECFRSKGATRRLYKHVVHDLCMGFDKLDTDEGELPDPGNRARARAWVDRALVAEGTPLSVTARKRP